MCSCWQTKFAERTRGLGGRVCESPLKFHSAVWLPTIRRPTRPADHLPSISARASSVRVSAFYLLARTLARRRETTSLPRVFYPRVPWAGTIGGAYPTAFSPQSRSTGPPPTLPDATYYHLPRNPPCNRHVRIVVRVRELVLSR